MRSFHLAVSLIAFSLLQILISAPHALSQSSAAIPITSIIASGFQNPNSPENTLDKNLDTRWSAEGNGQWIQYDLGTPQTISEVRIAWHRGNVRTAGFVIEISLDAVEWSEVFNGRSSGTTLNLQSYAFSEITAQFVRILGFGNTENAWNSITEVEIHGSSTPEPLRHVEGVIPAIGGSLELLEIAAITFPAGAFPADQKIKIATTASAETNLDFTVTGIIFSAEFRTPYEIRINTGTLQSALPVEAIINIPSGFLVQVPTDSEIQVFAQIFEDGGEEILDSFELFFSTLSAEEQTITVTLPVEAFTNRRTLDETFEAIILLATTPTKPDTIIPSSQTFNHDTRSSFQEESLPPPPDAVIISPGDYFSLHHKIVRATDDTDICGGTTLLPPLDAPVVTSKFNPLVRHYGTDFKAINGTSVKSMASGIVESIRFDERPLPKPDPRSGKKVKGYGHYIVIRHEDGSKSIYGHLDGNGIRVKEGDKVTGGFEIALSDNSGGSQAPHLHVEYAPNGRIYEKF